MSRLTVFDHLINHADHEEVFPLQGVIAVNYPTSVTPTQANHASLNPGILLELKCGIEPADSLKATGSDAQIQIPAIGKEPAWIAAAEYLVLEEIYKLELTANPTGFPKLQMTPLSPGAADVTLNLKYIIGVVSANINIFVFADDIFRS